MALECMVVDSVCLLYVNGLACMYNNALTGWGEWFVSQFFEIELKVFLLCG